MSEAALGIPAGGAAFIPQELQRYKALEDEITSLIVQQVEPRLGDSNAAVHQLTATLQAERQQLAAAAAAEKKEAELVDKYQNHWGCCAFLLGKQKQAQHITQHEELQQKHAAQRAFEAQRCQEVEKSLRAAQQEQAVWQGKVNHLRGLQAEAQSLLNAMFSRPPWPSDPTLAPLLGQAASLHSQAAGAQSTAGIYCTAKVELGNALAMCHQAAQLLQAAGWLGYFEMGMDFGTAMMDPGFGMERRGAFGEFIQMMEIQQAQEMIRAAAQQIQKARSILPTVPFIQEALVSSCLAGIFADILVGNFFSEMIIIQQVHASMYRVGAMMQQVQKCVGWCQANQSAFQGQQGQLEAQAAAKEAEVEAFKRQRVQAALSRDRVGAAVV